MYHVFDNKIYFGAAKTVRGAMILATKTKNKLGLEQTPAIWRDADVYSDKSGTMCHVGRPCVYKINERLNGGAWMEHRGRLEAVSKTYHVYGYFGSRQRESFHASLYMDMREAGYGRTCQVFVKNCDITGTNQYSEVVICGPSEEEIDKEMSGQLSDGIFENSRVGFVTVVDNGYETAWENPHVYRAPAIRKNYLDANA